MPKRRPFLPPAALPLVVLLVMSCAVETAYAQGLQSATESVTISTSPSPLATGCARSWYGSKLSLLTRAQTELKHYDGSSIGIEMTCSSASEGTFLVSLYRVESSSTQFLGSATFKRRGFTKATWNGVGSGSYYFVFSKANDGTLVTSSDAATYSW